MAKLRIRKDDTVIVIAGKEKGKTGKVLRVLPDKGRVVVERLNIVKRHSKSRGQQGPQGIVEKEAPIHISNVMIYSDNSPSRVGAKILEDGRKVRIAKRSGEQLDN